MSRDYYEVFLKRCNGGGKTEANLVIDRLKWNFNNLLKISPNSITITLEKNLKQIESILLTQKDTDTVSQKYLLTRIDDKLNNGELFFWEEKTWMVMRTEESAVQGYNKYLALECKHNIEWVDFNGVEQKTPCFLLGNINNKIREQFKMVDPMIYSHTNLSLQIIMPARILEKNQRMIIKDSAWKVIAKDHLSVDGVVYVLLAEDAKNLAYDTPELNDTNRLEESYIVAPQKVELKINEDFTFNFATIINGKKVNDDFLIFTNNERLIKIENSTIKALNKGAALITVVSKQYKIEQEINIIIEDVSIEKKEIQILGSDYIKPGLTNYYEIIYLINGVRQNQPVAIEVLDENKLLKSTIQENAVILCEETRNNKIGEVKIIASFENEKAEKIIQVKSLWG